MRILQITKYFYPAISFGGPVQCTYNLSKYLVRRGHEVTVYATDALNINTRARITERCKIIDGIKVFYFRNVAKIHGFFISPSMIRVLQNNLDAFDVVHLHEYRTFQNLVFHRLNRNCVPYVLSCHGEFQYTKESLDAVLLRRLYEYGFGRKMAGDADRLLALTPVEAAQFLNSDIERNKIVVIPNGVAPEDFLDVPCSGTFRKSYRISNGAIILYLGRIHEQKGIDVLVKAFALLSKGRNDVRLAIAGPDDGFLNYLTKLVERLDLSGKVVFTGALDRKQVLAAYADASVIVYPSLHEGFAVVPLEAGIMGKPIIVSDVPALDFVRKGRFGLTVEYGNVDQLRDAIETLLDNPELSRQFSENGKEFVKKHYSWDVIGQKIEDTYRSVLR